MPMQENGLKAGNPPDLKPQSKTLRVLDPTMQKHRENIKKGS